MRLARVRGRQAKPLAAVAIFYETWRIEICALGGAVLDALESPSVQQAVRAGQDTGAPRRAELACR